jgi:hypothetical protein
MTGSSPKGPPPVDVQFCLAADTTKKRKRLLANALRDPEAKRWCHDCVAFKLPCEFHESSLKYSNFFCRVRS